MKILLLPRYGRLGASSRLRTLQYVDFLESRGATIDVAPFFSDGYVSALYAGRSTAVEAGIAYLKRVSRLAKSGSYDIVWTEKELLPWVAPGLEKGLSRAVGKLIVDIDDAVFHRYDMHRSSFVRRLLGHKIDDVMARSALVLAGNSYLGRRAHDAGAKHVEVVPTVVDLARYPAPPGQKSFSETGPVKVGWIGSPSTAHYLRSISADLPASVDGREVQYIAIGARGDQLTGTPFISRTWSEEGEVGLLQELDIGIMPLLDTPWERGKCGYKLIQYMACGLPVIASPIGVNGEVVGNAGVLAASGPEWRAAIEQLVANPERRSVLGFAGRARVENTYSLQAQAPRIERLFTSLVSG